MVDTRFSVSLQIMVTLGYHGQELVNSEYLARSLKTNATFIRKLVTRLVDAGLVESFRGQGGGVRLAKSCDQINLKEIYLAATAEKPLVSSHKKPALKACPVSCAMGQIFCDIVSGMEKSTQAYLTGKRLSDVLKKVPVLHEKY